MPRYYDLSKIRARNESGGYSQPFGKYSNIIDLDSIKKISFEYAGTPGYWRISIHGILSEPIILDLEERIPHSEKELIFNDLISHLYILPIRTDEAEQNLKKKRTDYCLLPIDDALAYLLKDKQIQNLKEAGIQTMGDLAKKSYNQLKMIKGIGNASIVIIDDKLNDNNISREGYNHES